MPMPRKRIIWLFAFGFLIFYTPYAALSKAVTAGLLPGLPKGLPGLEILPAAILGTVLMVPLIITSLRWWKYASWRRIAGIPFPVTTREIAISRVVTGKGIPAMRRQLAYFHHRSDVMISGTINTVPRIAAGRISRPGNPFGRPGRRPAVTAFDSAAYGV